MDSLNLSIGFKGKTMKKAIILVIASLSVWACTSSKKLFEPWPEDVQHMSEKGIKTDLVTLQKGYQLYSSHCNNCHGLTAPPRKSMEQWNKILPKMFPKTNLTKEEQEVVKSYIAARR
jgi:cytochrome c5